MEEAPINKENYDAEKSPIKDAYFLLGAKTPLELSRLYTAEDQRLMKSHEWDYKNPDLLTNKVKNILESASLEVLTEDEQEWREEILWFWYHHAISTAIALYKDIDSAKVFAENALQHQPEDNPNKITRLMYLLLNDRLVEAENLAASIPEDILSDGEPNPEPITARDMITAYKTGGALNIVF